MKQKTYIIKGKYQDKSAEKIDQAYGKNTAYYLIGEYSMAFGKDWQIWAEDRQGNKLNDALPEDNSWTGVE